jgi:hypothetical protein
VGHFVIPECKNTKKESRVYLLKVESNSNNL